MDRKRLREEKNWTEIAVAHGMWVMTYDVNFMQKVAPRTQLHMNTYRGELKGLYVLLNRTQAGQGRAVKHEQDENSRNHVQAFFISLSKRHCNSKTPRYFGS